jgi:8-oxo-dGTP pyrophosphatase MutT (NUDIX family)
MPSSYPEGHPATVGAMIERRAARVLLVADGSVLLIKGFDPARPEAGTWWITPGGGVDADESLEAAATREVLEETGLRLPPAKLGDVVATRVAEFEFEQQWFRQTESFFAVRLPRFPVSAAGWDDLERRSLLDHRWWTVDELEATDETVYPRELARVVAAVCDDRIAAPIQLSGS